MRKIIIVASIALVLALLIWVKIRFFSPATPPGMPAGGPGKMPPSPVTVQVLSPSEGREAYYTSGTLLANEEVELKPEIGGRVVQLYLPEGGTVSTGTLLLKLNDAELKAQLQKTTVQLNQAYLNEARQRRMLNLEGTSKQEYESALSTLNGLKADSAYLAAQIAKTELRAPFTGVIGVRNISPGSVVSNTTVLATLQQVNPLKLEFNLPEKYNTLLKTGAKINFTVEGLSETFGAVLTLKDPKIDPATRQVRYRAACDNSRGLLLPGGFARVSLPIGQGEQALFVPTEAVIGSLRGSKVYVVKNGQAEERQVETGLRIASGVQILKGLEAGDSVVVTGNFQLKPGATLRILPANKK